MTIIYTDDLITKFKASNCDLIITIDTKNLERIKEHSLKWCVSFTERGLPESISARSAIIHKTVVLSRVIINLLKEKNFIKADHFDRDVLNNTENNLRACNNAQNSRNRVKKYNSYSKYKGVGFDKKRGTWTSVIIYRGKRLFIGRFTSDTEAALAYNLKAKEFHKDFANLNVISS